MDVKKGTRRLGKNESLFSLSLIHDTCGPRRFPGKDFLPSFCLCLVPYLKVSYDYGILHNYDYEESYERSNRMQT